MLPDELRQAGNLIRAGRSAEARPVLARYVQLHPDSEQGWLLLSMVLRDRAQQIDCLERVLKINPGNGLARERLAQFQVARQAPPASPSAPPFEPPAPAPQKTSSKPSTPPAPVCARCRRRKRNLSGRLRGPSSNGRRGPACSPASPGRLRPPPRRRPNLVAAHAACGSRCSSSSPSPRWE